MGGGCCECKYGDVCTNVCERMNERGREMWSKGESQKQGKARWKEEGASCMHGGSTGARVVGVVVSAVLRWLTWLTALLLLLTRGGQTNIWNQMRSEVQDLVPHEI